MKPACKDCFWWTAINTYVEAYGEVATVAMKGFCHVRPPISGKQPWPQTLPTDFCRCFKSKEDVE